MAVPFDPESLETTGAQVAVTDGLFVTTVYNAGFDVSRHGTLIHVPGGLVGVDRRLMFIDRETQQITEPWSDDRRPFETSLSVSPDGRRLAVTLINADRYYEIWTSEMDRPRLTRFVAEPGLDCVPGGWHPDGERVTYVCASADRGALYLRSVEGTDAPRMLGQWTAANEFILAYGGSFTLDGAHVIMHHQIQGKSKLVRLSLNEPDATPVLLLEGASVGTISPDGRYLVYSSDASGRTEIYLRSIDADLRLGREVPVTRDGADFAWWSSPAGKPLTIAYLSSGRLYELKVTPGDRVRLSEPRLLGDMSEVNSKLRGNWFDLRDGRLLAIVQGEGEEIPQELTVVVNWRREFEERLRAER